jgi:hypothetical protein
MNASHLDGESGEDRSKEGPAVPVGINVPKWYVYRPLKGKGGPMKLTTYGLDIEKHVFQMYWIEGSQR